MRYTTNKTGRAPTYLVDPYDDLLMRIIDEIYTKMPLYGSRRITKALIRTGYHVIYPYLLRNVVIDRPDFVWSSDITYIRLSKGFIYLAVIMDWRSRYVLSWELSIGLNLPAGSLPTHSPQMSYL